MQKLSCPQKTDPNHIRITSGGNLIEYPGEITTRTADLTTSKILWNIIISNIKAKHMCIDINFFNLYTLLDRYEYMQILLSAFLEHIIQQYNSCEKAKNGSIDVNIQRPIYWIPQLGALANKQLKENLAQQGYFEVTYTQVLWQHITRKISFPLVVDNFGVKYIDKAYADHLIAALKTACGIAEDWTGGLYCGIKLKCNYDRYLNKRYVDIFMRGYITKKCKNTNMRYPHAPNIHHINLPRRIAKHQNKNHFNQMNPIPLPPKVPPALKK